MGLTRIGDHAPRFTAELWFPSDPLANAILIAQLLPQCLKRFSRQSQSALRHHMAL